MTADIKISAEQLASKQICNDPGDDKCMDFPLC